jgi:hypothetical protein
MEFEQDKSNGTIIMGEIMRNLVSVFFNSGFVLSRQVLYHLIHACSPFCSSSFGDRLLCFGQAGLDNNLLF